MYIEYLKDMFQEMVVNKDPSKIPEYYHKDFLLFSNGEQMDYETFLNLHERYYGSQINYEVQFEDETFLEQGEKVSGRIWITTKKSDESAQKIEVILIVLYKEGKIFRIWELTYPDWSKMPIFQCS